MSCQPGTVTGFVILALLVLGLAAWLAWKGSE
jgi:hypothetical protein